MCWQRYSSRRHLSQLGNSLRILVLVGRAIVPDRHVLHKGHALTLDRLAHDHKRALAASTQGRLEHDPRIVAVDFHCLPSECAHLVKKWVEGGMPFAHACQSPK